MTLIGMLLLVLFVVVGGLVANWVISTFFPAPAQMVARAIVGILLLLVLLFAFAPEAMTHRLW